MLIKFNYFLIIALYSSVTVHQCCVTLDSRPNWSISVSSVSSSRVSRDVSLQERSKCSGNVSQPPNRIDTSQRVQELMDIMNQHNIDAYIVPTADEHQSEYVSESDARRDYISGFSGSAGTAVILATGVRALWTDGRYFLQADEQLDCKWLLMKERNEGVPTILEWLKLTLPPNSVVSADPKLISAKEWMDYAKSLKESSITFEPSKNNFIDEIWPDTARLVQTEAPIEILEMKFAGKRWEDKVADLRMEMRKLEADMMIITAMDENAWLFNLRGGDVPHNPVFRSYTILDNAKIRLFLDQKIGAEVDLHLNVNQCDNECVDIQDYKSVLQTLQGLTSQSSVKTVLLPSPYSYSGGASYAILMSVPESKRLLATSPVLSMKARKNDVEINGMKNAHIKDAVALTDFLSLMEEEIPAGKNWDEISAATRLEAFRAEQLDFHSLSFTTISAFGPNGAIIHYTPSEATNDNITDKSLYLLDSGGQYKDGTTDVTRTLHYGTPTSMQKEAYTRVLKGAVDIATLVFPKGTKDTRIDILARRSLYEVGLDYNHGTGHGIGMFLNIHEGPIQMRVYGVEEHDLEVGHFFSDEPGYYKTGEFGIRLETIVHVVRRPTKYQSEAPMLGLEPVTLVPFEPKLIDIPLLDRRQCEYLNQYHVKIRQIIGPELDKQGRTRAKAYMMERTEPLNCRKAGTVDATENLPREEQIRMNKVEAQQSSLTNSSSRMQLSFPVIVLVCSLLAVVQMLKR